MGRYDNLTINKTDNNKRYYTAPIYPEIEQQDNDDYIISHIETRLDLLAFNYYNDATLYWIIAICNNIQGSIFVEPGKQLCIPNINRIPDILSEYNVLNRG